MTISDLLACPPFRAALPAILSLLAAACGRPLDAPGDAEPEPGGASAEASTPGPSPGAAATTAATDPYCSDLGGFYWEIGSASSSTPLASGSIPGSDGKIHYTRSTEMKIASASKLVFGAYVVQRNAALLAQPANHAAPSDPGLAAAFQALTMRAGYVSFSYEMCALFGGLNPKVTVDDCFHYGNGDKFTGADVGHFDYDGGHFQFYADTALGLGGKTSAALTTELQSVLGPELGLGFASPQLAAGMSMSAAEYAAFLRKILSGNLAISQYLAYAPTCTSPPSGGAGCAGALYSPASPRAWHYSWGHWIEDDPSQNDDGAYSSPGAFGFYPWIDHGAAYYGVLARLDQTHRDAYVASVQCGQDIRKAFFSGKVYHSGAPQSQ